MAITIQLSPDGERSLDQLARENGKEPASLARELLEQGVSRQLRHASEDAQPEGLTELDRAIARFTQRTPDEIKADRERLEPFIELGRPLPPGQSIFDAIAGKWPGDETDEEVERALKELR